uniref:Uncharacterized protein n=1 Tax=Setaria italica TaxID=4555 RepID=K3ZP85_SETIT
MFCKVACNNYTSQDAFYNHQISNRQGWSSFLQLQR